MKQGRSPRANRFALNGNPRKSIPVPIAIFASFAAIPAAIPAEAKNRPKPIPKK
jgi:hypothetical protein